VDQPRLGRQPGLLRHRCPSDPGPTAVRRR
jgi:hypothetical protein